MQERQRRAIEEAKALNEKVQGLKVFLGTPEFEGLKDRERLLLTRQLWYMEGYSYTLDLRILHLNKRGN